MLCINEVVVSVRKYMFDLIASTNVLFLRSVHNLVGRLFLHSKHNFSSVKHKFLPSYWG